MNDQDNLRNSPNLSNLATRARDLHGQVIEARKRGLSLAMDTGDVLIQAREWVEHGGWGKWLAGAGINERTARLYMQVARNRDALETATVAGLREAAEWLASVSTAPKAGHVFLATERETEDAWGFPRTIAIVPSAMHPAFFHIMRAEPGGEAVMTDKPVLPKAFGHYGIPDRVSRKEWAAMEVDAGWLDDGQILARLESGDLNPFHDFLEGSAA